MFINLKYVHGLLTLGQLWQVAVRAGLWLKSALILGLFFLASGGLLYRLYFRSHQVASDLSSVEGASKSEILDPTTLVFAGLSGSDPMYIESGPNKGNGYVEYYTHEIRKGVRQDGFKIKQEYMTPARIAYEFRRKAPICTYPAEWSDPKSFFSKKPDRIYSIPLEFGGEEREYIVTLKAKLPLFKKHLDPKGDLRSESLIHDASLSTLLIQDKDYGPLNELLLDKISEQSEPTVKPELRRHIHLKVLHENRQLIEMLNSGNIDYIFSRSFDLAVLSQAKLEEQKFAKLPFSSIAFASIDDPRIKFHSVSCSLHPLTMRAMPYFNKWISQFREVRFKERKVYYQNKLLPEFARNETYIQNRFSARFREEIASGKLDQFYAKQQQYFPELALYPQEEPPPVLPPLTNRRKELTWFLFKKDREVAVLNSASLHHRLYSEALNNHKGSIGYNAFIFDHRFLTPLLPAWLQQILRTEPLLQAKTYAHLSEVRLPAETDSLILNGAGLSYQEIAPLLLPSLKSIFLWDGSAELMGQLVRALPPEIERVNFTDSMLTGSGIEKRISELKRLRDLHISSGNLLVSEMTALVQGLPKNLRALSLSSMTPSFDRAFYQLFAQRDFSELEYFDFSSNGPDEEDLDALHLERLRSLKYLNLRSLVTISTKTREAINSLPQLEELNLYGIGIGEPVQLRSSVFQRLVTPNTQLIKVRSPLKSLDIVYSAADTDGLFKTGYQEIISHYLKHLNSTLSELSINQIPASSFLESLLSLKHLRHIGSLDLSLSDLDDTGAKRLSKAPFSIDTLTLYNNKITNQGVESLLPILGQLKGLNLSFNFISEDGVLKIAQKLSPKLYRLELSNLMGLDATSLAKHLPKALKCLSLAGNSISDQDMLALAPQLPQGLFDLVLRGSTFGEIGSHALAEHMPPFLASLDLLGTPVGDQGLAWILRVLPASISEIALRGIQISPETAALFAKNMPPFLRRLRLEQISGPPVALQTILSALPKSLEYLSISGTVIGSEGGNILAQIPLPQLRQIDLFGAQIGGSRLDQLGATLFKRLNRFELSDPTITEEGLLQLLNHPLEHLTYLNIKNPIGERVLAAIAKHQPRISWLLLTPENDAALRALTKFNFTSTCTVNLGSRPYDPKVVLQLIRNLNGPIYNLILTSINFPYEAVDQLVKILPKSLVNLSLTGNPVGLKGFEKVEAESARRRLALGFGYTTIK